MKLKTHCPGCGDNLLSEPWRIPNQPVILNYRFGSSDSAKEVPRRDMHLAECSNCGLIFNSSLDESVIAYDQNYDNRQGFSAIFNQHLNDVAEMLISRHKLSNGLVFEVGCGKGDFLRKVCEISGSTGIGFDTSCEEVSNSDEKLFFSCRYATEEDVPAKVNVIICRHVIEHVSEIGEFLTLLHRMAVKGNVDVVYLETPVWEWIVDHGAFWDVFYEHCNYFPSATLARLVELKGFIIDDHQMVFGGQYQGIFLKPCLDQKSPKDFAGIPSSMMRFASKVDLAIETLRERIRQTAFHGTWGIWGAGAKGVTLANRLSELSPAFVVDANPDKCGNFVPGTSVPIVDSGHEIVKRAGSVLIANPNYYPEIRDALSARNLDPEILFL